MQSKPITFVLHNIKKSLRICCLMHPANIPLGIRVISYNGCPTVTQGQHADLTCELIETDELIQISWQKSTRGYRANHNFFLITLTYGPSHVKGRGDRVDFIGNTTALVGSVRLGDVSLTEGVYTCIFTVFPSGPYKTKIHLTVQSKRLFMMYFPNGMNCLIQLC